MQNLMRWAIRKYLWGISYAIPMLSILEGKYRDDSKRVIRRLNAYKKIFTYLDDIHFFRDTTKNLYAGIREGKRLRDLPVDAVEQKLRNRLRLKFMEVVGEIRSFGYGREADKIEGFVENGEFKNAYLTLKEIRDREKRDVRVDNLTLKIGNMLTNLSVLQKINSDVSEIQWSLAELLGVNRLKIPEKKMIFINDIAGNAGCFLSLYLKRVGVEYTYISTKNAGDYWITNQNVSNAISPVLRVSEIGERITKSDKLVIVEDINYLILNNKFSEIYGFLQYVKNNTNKKVIFTGSFKMLNEREISRLRGIFDTVMTIDFIFNICSSSVIAVRERVSRGSLLLSKELVDDFNGKVIMVADFGGDRYIHPQRLDFEIADNVHQYLKSGDVVIDCADLLIDENGLDKMYVWLKNIRDFANLSGNKVYMVTNNLISKEKEYLSPVLDVDSYHLFGVDTKKLAVVQKKLEIINTAIERKVEKECAYNLEVIRHKYNKYKKYLTDIKDEAEDILRETPEFNLDFLIDSTPLREKINVLVEKIEKESEKFNSEYDKSFSILKIAKEYVGVEDVGYCLENAKNAFDRGDMDRALDKIQQCSRKARKLMDKVYTKADEIKNELQCVNYLLPIYFQNKLVKFKVKISDIKEFTHIYRDLNKIVREKIENEYAKIKKYAIVSGIPLLPLDSQIREGKYCEYLAEKNKFMEEFDKRKDDVETNMRDMALRVVRFLEDSGYKLPFSADEIRKTHNFETLFAMVDRIYNHLSMYISKNLDDVKKRYPEYAEKHSKDIEKIIVALSINPQDAILRYKSFINKLHSEMGIKKARMIEIKKNLKDYYAILKHYGIPFEEWYPKKVDEGEVVLGFLGKIFGDLNPEIEVSVQEIEIYEDRYCNLKIEMENIGNTPAKNVSVEVYGAVKSNEKLELLKNGEKKNIAITAKLDDPAKQLNMDVFFETVSGTIHNKTFSFEVNLEGYSIIQATGLEHCALCRGKIFKGKEMVVCSECGATYHRPCAERLSKCKMCGNPFFF